MLLKVCFENFLKIIGEIAIFTLVDIIIYYSQFWQYQTQIWKSKKNPKKPSFSEFNPMQMLYLNNSGSTSQASKINSLS